MSTEENGFPGMLLAHQNMSRRIVLRNLTAFALAGGGIAQLITACGSASPGATTRPSPGPASSSLYTYRGHTKSVNALAWSSDGKRIASGSADKTVQIWDAVDGGHVFTYRGHTGDLDALAWSPDDKTIASGGVDAGLSEEENSAVQVWEATRGSLVSTFKGACFEVSSVSWSPDSKYVTSSCSEGYAYVWEAASGKRIFAYAGHQGSMNVVAWSPDDTRIASGGDDQTFQVWDAMTGAHACTRESGHLTFLHI